MTRAGRVAAVLALAFVAAVHVVAAARMAQRKTIDGDETELLQAGLRMARGERIYVDFFEHHAPLIPRALAFLAPGGAPYDAYLLRARLIAIFFGTLALAAAAFLVWRATGVAYAPVIFIGVLLASPPLWTRAFAQVRSEPPALAAFWCGALLILSRRTTFGALGIGLVTLSCLLNPKWPVASVILGVLFLAAAAKGGRRSLIRGILIGTAAAAAAVLLLALAGDLRRYLDFVFVFSRAMFSWWRTHQWMSADMPVGFLHCPRLLRPQYVLPLAAIVVTAALLRREAFRSARLAVALVALLVASLIEIRFVDPYPVLWVHYYALWGMAGAGMYAFVPQAIIALVKPIGPYALGAARAVPVVATLLAAFNALAVMPLPGSDEPPARAMAGLASLLRPGDTVFVTISHHPLGAADASYYWFGFVDVIPAALDFATTPAGRRILPPIREADLPPCRLERGLDPHLRLVTGGDEIAVMKVLSGCVARLRARGVLVPARVKDVFFVRRGPALQ